MMLDGATDYQIFQRTHVVKNYAAIGHFFNSVTNAGAVRFGVYGHHMTVDPSVIFDDLGPFQKGATTE